MIKNSMKLHRLKLGCQDSLTYCYAVSYTILLLPDFEDLLCSSLTLDTTRQHSIHKNNRNSLCPFNLVPVLILHPFVAVVLLQEEAKQSQSSLLLFGMVEMGPHGRMFQATE